MPIYKAEGCIRKCVDGIHVAKGYLKTFRPLAALRLLLEVRRHYGDVVPTLTYHGLDKYISYLCRR